MKPILAVALAFSLSAIADEYPPATDHIADCENRWILLQGKDPGTRILAFAYVDPEAGVTINVSGEVAFGEDGALVRKPSALQGSGRVIARVTSNYEVICLTVAQVANLGVPPSPDWLKFYEGIGGELGPHNASWASHYNHIGAFAKALELIRAAISVGFSSPGLHFEHAFALNALRRFEEAATVSKAAVMEHPDNVELLAELAYSYLKLNDYKQSIKMFEEALSRDKQSQSGRRADFAQNIAFAYAQFGDATNSKRWLETAQNWRSGQQ